MHHSESIPRSQNPAHPAHTSAWPGHATTWIFHSGAALGDFVLCFPLVRTLVAHGHTVAIIAAASKAALARAVFAREGASVHGVPDHLHHLSNLWRESIASNAPTPPRTPAAREIYHFTAPIPTAARWLARARETFPHATIHTIDRPLDRVLALSLAAQPHLFPARITPAPAHTDPPGPLIMHIGAGSHSKRWPLHRWLELHHRLASANDTRPHAVNPEAPRIRLIAGEVEREQFSATDIRTFESTGGHWIIDLPELFATLAAARGYIGADTGPTHLAAQLGLPTLALFGPTDPNRWAPIGPRVRVLAPAQPMGMEWLTADAVHTQAASLLREIAQPNPTAS